MVAIGRGFAGPCTAVLEAGTDASYLMLTVLGGVAELERDLIRACTSEGRERAKARGCQARSQAEHQSREAIPEARLSTASAARHRLGSGIRLASDSPLEEDGFEPSVPRWSNNNKLRTCLS